MKTGIRPLAIEGQIKHHNIMQLHGLRKFFETNAFRAGMEHMYIRRLMGQKSGLEDSYSYLKLSEEELLEGDNRHIGYIGIIDQLTIDDKHRLQDKVKKPEIEVSKYDGVMARLAEMEKKIGLE
jgi:hypothetical protein